MRNKINIRQAEDFTDIEQFAKEIKDTADEMLATAEDCGVPSAVRLLMLQILNNALLVKYYAESKLGPDSVVCPHCGKDTKEAV